MHWVLLFFFPWVCIWKLNSNIIQFFKIYFLITRVVLPGDRELTPFSQVEIDLGQTILGIWIRYFSPYQHELQASFSQQLGTSVLPMNHRWFEETQCGPRHYLPLTEFPQQNCSWQSELVSRYDCVRCLNSFYKKKMRQLPRTKNVIKITQPFYCWIRHLSVNTMAYYSGIENIYQEGILLKNMSWKVKGCLPLNSNG